MGGLLGFYEAETLSLVSSLLLNVKGYASQQKGTFKLFTDNFYRMQLD